MQAALFRGPGDVFQTITEINYSIPHKQAVERKANYVRFQEKWQNHFKETVGKNEPMPPCCKCSPIVMCYCEDTETECKLFEKYTTGCLK